MSTQADEPTTCQEPARAGQACGSREAKLEQVTDTTTAAGGCVGLENARNGKDIEAQTNRGDSQTGTDRV